METDESKAISEGLDGEEAKHTLGEDESTTYVPRPTLGVVGKREYAPGDPQPEDETDPASDLMSDFVTEISPEDRKMAPGPSEDLDEPLVELLLPPIEAAWNKTVQGLFEVGSLLKQAKERLGKSYTQLVDRLPFSATTAGNLVRVAEHKVLSDPAYWDRLPKALEKLYYLSRLDADRVIEAIGSGEITPELTLAKAKELVGVGEPRDSGLQGTAEQYVDVVVSIPKSADLRQAVQAVLNLAQTYDGTLDYRKNEKSVGEFWLETMHQKALDGIADSKGQLPNTLTYDEMCELDEGPAEELLKGKTKSAAGDSSLPDSYPNIDALRKRTGLHDITLSSFKKWCIKNGIPTRVALSAVDQPVYVWEQLRLIAEQQDEKAARRRLESIRKGKNLTIAKLALDVLDMLDNMMGFENQAEPKPAESPVTQPEPPATTSSPA